MIPGVLVLVERSLRVDARAWAPHLARFGLMIAIYVAVIYATATSSMFGAPGLRFFRTIAYLNLVFMTLMGIGYFSTAITEEKEEDTLGLMLMAGINPLSLLLGKSVARLIQALLLVAIQYPFTLLAVTMGGVTQYQVQSAYVAMLTYMVLLSGVGLFCSTLARQNRTASFRLMIFVAVYIMIPVCCSTWLAIPGVARFRYAALLNWIAESCVFVQMNTIMTTGFQEQLYDHPMVLTHLTIGGLGYVLSWALFGLAVRDLSSDPVSRGLTARPSGKHRMFAAGRPKIDPFVWKDFHFVSGGVAALLIRIVLYASIYAVAIGMAEGLLIPGPVSPGTSRPKETTGIFLALMMFAIAIDAGLLASRCLFDEVRGQTLSTLMMLPTTTGRILYAKLLGAMLVWLPGPALIVFGIFCLPHGRECFTDFFRRPGAPLWLIAHLLLVPHASAMAALYVRWGALPLAICGTISSLFLSGSFFEAIHASEDHPAVYFVTFVVLAVCSLCHVGVWLRTEALSAK